MKEIKCVNDTRYLGTVFLCSFHTTIYPCPENASEREKKKDQLAQMLQELTTVRCYGPLTFIADAHFDSRRCFDTVSWETEKHVL